MKLRLLLISTIAVILIAFPMFPVYSEFQTPSNKPTSAAIPTVYARSASRVSATPGNMYTPVTASTNLPSATNATIFLTVGTFIPAGQCCFGGYLIGYSIDSGTFIGICGAETSRFTNVLITDTCFTRTTLPAGSHTLGLVVDNPDVGAWTIEAGSTTAILVEFN